MAHIAVVGSVAVDEVVRVHGSLRPGSHAHGVAQGERLGGGAAGFALPLCRLGHRVSLFAAVGQDEAGARLKAELVEAGIDVSTVASVEGPSTRSLVLVDDRGERTVLNLHRCSPLSPAPGLAALNPDALYVRSRQADLAPLLAQHTSRALVVAHVPPCDPGARPAHVLVGSEADLPGDWTTRAWEAGRAVAGPALKWVVITRGSDGAMAHGPEGERHVPAPLVSAVDTTGAGDAFAAGLAHALLAGARLERALEVAVAWGAEATRWASSVLPADAVPRLPLL